MPAKNVTSSSGNVAIIDASPSRRGILVTNDSGYPVYWRQMGQVTAVDDATKGHILRPNGGCVMLTDFAAKAAFYACVPAGEPAVKITTEEYF